LIHHESKIRSEIAIDTRRLHVAQQNFHSEPFADFAVFSPQRLDDIAFDRQDTLVAACCLARTSRFFFGIAPMTEFAPPAPPLCSTPPALPMAACSTGAFDFFTGAFLLLARSASVGL
jgi:hypothetical protein